ncbi:MULTISPECIES: isopentenyl-diphosphate Delta-isomerase [unclassified Candidatus Tisiphia]|uniref:isopentenyl-diphosphate Delta-isomerase n=1 Tax=unclassified Candidatus Tisiphia TaxID=2996318 RepID=UPI00312CAF6F
MSYSNERKNGNNKQRVNEQSIYSNDLENWNVKQGVSERSVHLVHEHANAPKFCRTNSSKHSSIHVVLVDEQDKILGTEDKLMAHNSNTPLHRGVSVFLFNSQKDILIQRRSLLKKTWGGFWSNSFCGHPQINETYEQAVYRHAKFELGLVSLQKVYFIANYRYKFAINNIVENEICPIYLALSDDVIRINEQEIAEVKLLKWQDFKLYTEEYSANFSPWCKEELKILENSEIFKKFMDSAL